MYFSTLVIIVIIKHNFDCNILTILTILLLGVLTERNDNVGTATTSFHKSSTSEGQGSSSTRSIEGVVSTCSTSSDR